MSETTGTERVGEPDRRDRERDDPSTAGKPEVTAMDDEETMSDDGDIPTGRTEEREERQHGVQQHGDTFTLDDERNDGEESDGDSGSNRVSALPRGETATEVDTQEERGRLGNDPLEAPWAEELEEENPTESPASDSQDEAARHEGDAERAASSPEPPRPVGKSTEGLTIGGSENRPDDRPR